MKELKGAPVANALTEACKKDIARLMGKTAVPKLAIVRVGERQDDLAYERGILKRFSLAGATAEVHALPHDVSQSDLEQTMARLNADANTHGILVFRPLPAPLCVDRIKNLILPAKDIDCMSRANTAAIFEGSGSGHPPCTPQAVLELLDFYQIDLTGRNITVIGRSMVVGKPLAMMLVSKNATVTLCHTKTRDLPAHCKTADIIIACAGKAKMLGTEMVRPGQIVIDVGINMVGDRLCGDADGEAIRDIVEAFTPVPGGIGAVTTSVLLQNTVNAVMALNER